MAYTALLERSITEVAASEGVRDAARPGACAARSGALNAPAVLMDKAEARAAISGPDGRMAARETTRL